MEYKNQVNLKDTLVISLVYLLNLTVLINLNIKPTS